MYYVEMNGLEKVLKNIEKYSKELADGIDDELSEAAQKVAVGAIFRAPMGRSGALKGSIRADTTIRFNKTVSAGISYAPYVEFGTGARVFKTPLFNFTSEMRAYAMEFYVSGKGRGFPHPYLFPALELEKPKLLAKIKERFFGRNRVL
jgi:hypothetical protein